MLAKLALTQHFSRRLGELRFERAVLSELLLPIKCLLLPFLFVEQAISVELNEAGPLTFCLLIWVHFVVLARASLQVRAEEGLGGCLNRLKFISLAPNEFFAALFETELGESLPTMVTFFDPSEVLLGDRRCLGDEDWLEPTFTFLLDFLLEF